MKINYIQILFIFFARYFLVFVEAFLSAAQLSSQMNSEAWRILKIILTNLFQILGYILPNQLNRIKVRSHKFQQFIKFIIPLSFLNSLPSVCYSRQAIQSNFSLPTSVLHFYNTEPCGTFLHHSTRQNTFSSSAFGCSSFL